MLFNFNKIIKRKNDISENNITEIIHDLKTPCAAQIKMCELMLNGYFGELESKQKEIILSVINSNKYMLNLINNYLFYSKYQDSDSIKQENFDINTLISTCAENIKYLAKEKNCSINTIFSKDEIIVSASFSGIERVIINLISNAVNYSDANTEITVISKIKNNYCKISVINHGKIIRASEKNDIFKKYNSIENRGFGLGLYISDIILSKHNTCIILESNEQKGNEFSFKLPLCNTNKAII